MTSIQSNRIDELEQTRSSLQQTNPSRPACPRPETIHKCKRFARRSSRSLPFNCWRHASAVLTYPRLFRRQTHTLTHHPFPHPPKYNVCFSGSPCFRFSEAIKFLYVVHSLTRANSSANSARPLRLRTRTRVRRTDGTGEDVRDLPQRCGQGNALCAPEDRDIIFIAIHHVRLTERSSTNRWVGWVVGWRELELAIPRNYAASCNLAFGLPLLQMRGTNRRRNTP